MTAMSTTTSGETARARNPAVWRIVGCTVPSFIAPAFDKTRRSETHFEPAGMTNAMIFTHIVQKL
jgi:hypothetical protein